MGLGPQCGYFLNVPLNVPKTQVLHAKAKASGISPSDFPNGFIEVQSNSQRAATCLASVPQNTLQ